MKNLPTKGTKITKKRINFVSWVFFVDNFD